MIGSLDAHIPDGPIDEKWDNHKFHMKLVAPHNRRRFEVIVVGTGLAGAAAAATLGELGYKVHCFTFHDSPRRAHSIAAQGGINAAKNYKGDGDSVHRLFYDTVKGGDYRAREANVYRLAAGQPSTSSTSASAQGVPFAREYGGLLDNRSFGGAQVSRTFYARGQTGQQLLLGAYQALSEQVELGNVELHTRTEMLDLVVVDGKAAGIVTRNLHSGEIRRGRRTRSCSPPAATATSSTSRPTPRRCNATAIWRAHKKGALFANPCFTQIHPTCIPASDDFQSKLTLMSESLRNDGRIWVPEEHGRHALARPDPRPRSATTTSSAATRRSATSCRATSRPAPPSARSTTAAASARRRTACTSTSPTPSSGLGANVIDERYDNLFEMYERITDEDPYKVPMRIYPAVHYTMGGLWVDYNLMSNIPGLYVIGEANFSDHGANRLGATALMQGLADGYFVLPNTIGDYLAAAARHSAGADRPRGVPRGRGRRARPDHPAAQHQRHPHGRLLPPGARQDHVGELRHGPQPGQPREGDLRDPRAARGVREGRACSAGFETLNQSLEKAGRVADFFELGELMCRDALHREESCGGHFRVEHQTDDGEALRDDDNFAYVAAWEWGGYGVDAGPAQGSERRSSSSDVRLAQRSLEK